MHPGGCQKSQVTMDLGDGLSSRFKGILSVKQGWIWHLVAIRPFLHLRWFDHASIFQKFVRNFALQALLIEDSPILSSHPHFLWTPTDSSFKNLMHARNTSDNWHPPFGIKVHFTIPPVEALHFLYAHLKGGLILWHGHTLEPGDRFFHLSHLCFRQAQADFLHVLGLHSCILCGVNLDYLVAAMCQVEWSCRIFQGGMGIII